eukprot:763138-Hanusia_phi.AAC.6
MRAERAMQLSSAASRTGKYFTTTSLSSKLLTWRDGLRSSLEPADLLQLVDGMRARMPKRDVVPAACGRCLILLHPPRDLLGNVGGQALDQRCDGLLIEVDAAVPRSHLLHAAGAEGCLERLGDIFQDLTKRQPQGADELLGVGA